MSEVSEPCKVTQEDELKRINFLTYGRLHIFAIKDNILKTKKNYYSIISDIIEFYSYLNFNDFTRYCGAKQSDKQNLLI